MVKYAKMWGHRIEIKIFIKKQFYIIFIILMEQVQSPQHRKKFAASIIVFQTVVIAALITLSRTSKISLQYDGYDYVIFSSLSLMIVLGFGLYLITIKKCGWSTLLFTLLIYVFSVQLYFVWKYIWEVALQEKKKDFILQINYETFSAAIKSSLPCIIAFGAVIGRVSQLQVLLITFIGISGYTLLQTIAKKILLVEDIGGSIFIFQFGAIYGLTISKMMSHKVLPNEKTQKQIKIGYDFKYFSMFGVFLLWSLWPLFNLPMSENLKKEGSCDRGVVINNTVFSLFGSATGGFVFWMISKKKLQINQLMYVTLAGAISAGSSTNLAIEPTVFFGVGILGSVVSCISFWQLSSFVKRICGIFDSSLILSSIGIPSIFGGVFTIISFSRLLDQQKIAGVHCLNFVRIDEGGDGRDYEQQSFSQFTAMLVSCFSAIIFGVVVGVLINYCCEEKQMTIKACYTDDYSFELSEMDAIYFPEDEKEKEISESVLQMDFS